MEIKLDFMAVLAFSMKAQQIIANIDSDKNGILSGPEKLDVAKGLINETLKDFPDIEKKLGWDPAKTEQFINAQVAALNIIVK